MPGIATISPGRNAGRITGLLAACAGVMALSGCANFSDISPREDDVYMVNATGVSYTMSLPALTAAAREKADAFCARQKMSADLRQLVRGWHPMQVELYFRCRAPGAATPLQARLN